MSVFLSKRLEFVCQVLVDYHDLIKVPCTYNNALNELNTLKDKLLDRLGSFDHGLKSSIYTNYRDAFQHFRRLMVAEQSGNEEAGRVEYYLILEHINRGFHDLYVDTFQKIYYLCRQVANSQKVFFIKTYGHVPEKVSVTEDKRAYKQMIYLKEGYLKAREGLLLLRARKKSIGRPICASFDFDDYDISTSLSSKHLENLEYYKKVRELLDNSYATLLAANKAS